MGLHVDMAAYFSSYCWLRARAVTSSSGKPISVQHVDVMNDVEKQSANSSKDAADAEQVSLRLSVKTSSLILNLTRHQFIDDQTPVYVAGHGNVTRWIAAPLNHVSSMRACINSQDVTCSLLHGSTFLVKSSPGSSRCPVILSKNFIGGGRNEGARLH